MVHFICTGGCKTISDRPGACESPTCPEYGEPLKECDCEDGKHYGAFEEENSKKHFLDEDDP